MADVKISVLPASAGLALADLLAVVDDPGGTPATQKATLTQLKTLLDTIYAPITGGAYVLKAGDTMTGLLTIAQATANTSALVSTGYSLTGANAQPLLSLAGTWNTSGAPQGILLNITDTASNAGSLLLALTVGGGPKFTVGKTGSVSVTNAIFWGLTPDDIQMLASANPFVVSDPASTVLMDIRADWATTGTPKMLSLDVINQLSGVESKFISCTSDTGGGFSVRIDGLVRVFNRINFLGDTSAFPSLKRSATVLQSRLADDSNFSPLQGLLRTAANAVTGLTAGVLSATTNASIVITDASGQAYRVPCII